MSRRICVVTGSRADYGLLRWVMQGLRDQPDTDLQIVATGAHLAPAFGLTYREIEADGFTIDRTVDLQLGSDSDVAIGEAMGRGVAGCAAALHELAPDIVLVLGDRYEILAAAAAATIARIPIAHLHGGETTQAAFDDAIRHAITKLSHLHFVAAEEYRRRVVQMGEAPDRVFLVGGLGVDAAMRVPLLERDALEAALDFRFAGRNLLVTFHPATLERGAAAHQTRELLAALDAVPDLGLIITMPNADPEGSVIRDLIDEFVGRRANARAFASLGQLRYLSCLRQVDGVAGNSSSGLTEVPTFRKGTINIGDRQQGRLKSASVIDCPPERDAIVAAIGRLYSTGFAEVLATATNPYGEGGASERIVSVLSQYPLEHILRKPFVDGASPARETTPAGPTAEGRSR